MTKYESKIISGIAIILMILLHTTAGSLFNIKSVIFDDTIITSIAMAGKICVSLFAFISGYGLWSQYKNAFYDGSDHFNGIEWSKQVHRVIGFLLKFWPFVFLGAILKMLFIHEFTFVELIKNMISWDFSYNAAYWYVRYYIFMVLILYPGTVLFYRSFICNLSLKAQKSLSLLAVLIMIVACLLLAPKTAGALCLFVFVSGELCAEWKIIDYIRSYKLLNITLFIIGVIFRSFYTDSRGGLTLDLLVIPMLLPAILMTISKLSRVGKILHVMGIHSTTMWFMHSYLYMYYDWPNEYLPSALVGWVFITLLSFVFAVLWDGLQRDVLNGVMKLKIRARN